MFKPGCFVKCINDFGVIHIILNKTYTIRGIYDNNIITLLGDDNLVRNYHMDRFILNISEQRKIKLEKICSNKEIK